MDVSAALAFLASGAGYAVPVDASTQLSKNAAGYSSTETGSTVVKLVGFTTELRTRKEQPSQQASDCKNALDAQASMATDPERAKASGEKIKNPGLKKEVSDMIQARQGAEFGGGVLGVYTNSKEVTADKAIAQGFQDTKLRRLTLDTSTEDLNVIDNKAAHAALQAVLQSIEDRKSGDEAAAIKNIRQAHEFAGSLSKKPVGEKPSVHSTVTTLIKGAEKTRVYTKVDEASGKYGLNAMKQSTEISNISEAKSKNVSSRCR